MSGISDVMTRLKDCSYSFALVNINFKHGGVNGLSFRLVHKYCQNFGDWTCPLGYQKILHTLNFGVSEITHKAKVSSCPNLFFNIKNFVKIKLFRADH